MQPLKTTLLSGAAIIALAAGPTLAQSTDADADMSTSAETTLGDGEINASGDTTLTDDGASGSATAEAEADADPLKKKTEDTAEAAGEALEDTGEAAMDTAEAAGETLEDGAEATADAASDTAEALTEGVEADAEATAEADAGASGEAAPGGPMTASSLIGTEVASSAGEDIGEIDDVIQMNGETMAVVGVGGFLGLGEHSVALPLTELDWQGETVTAFGYSKKQLESMQEYDAELATRVSPEAEVQLGGS